jgi:hypothetical protein
MENRDPIKVIAKNRGENKMKNLSPLFEITIEDLDKELLARGVQIPEKERFNFKDRKGTPQRKDIMEGVRELYRNAPQKNNIFSHFDTWDLVKVILYKTMGAKEFNWRSYQDERLDFFEISNHQILKNATGVAAICTEDSIIGNNKGTIKIRVKKYGKTFNLCQCEPYYQQPVSAGPLFTGFLVDDDIIATAGHCINKYNLKNLRIIFGYRMLDPFTPLTRIPNEHVYLGVKIIKRLSDIKKVGAEWTLLKLDRKVKGQSTVTLSQRPITKKEPFYVIGHPMGLPIKYAPGITINTIQNQNILAPLDLYMGNSGSPIFNALTHEVIGMVVRGDYRDFRWTGKGWLSVRYPNREIYAEGAQCMKASEIPRKP